MPTVELSGGRIHYETAGPADGRRMVCIHGYLMASSLWRPLSGLLAERGLRCLAPTWPLGAHMLEGARTFSMLDTPEHLARLIDEFSSSTPAPHTR